MNVTMQRYSSRGVTHVMRYVVRLIISVLYAHGVYMLNNMDIFKHGTCIVMELIEQ